MAWAGKKRKLLMFGVLSLMLCYLAVSSLTAYYVHCVISIPAVKETQAVVDLNPFINDVVSDDVMPDYFDLSQPDMVPQYIEHLNQTELIMKSRTARVKQWCKANNMKKPNFFLSMFELYQHPRYQFPNNLNWCPVFKAGSTNWKQFFCKLYRPEAYAAAQEVAEYCDINELHQYSAKLGQQQGLTFLTVRHPYERLVSAYRDKFEGCKEEMFMNTAIPTILHKYRAVNETITVKYTMLNAAKAQCRKKESEREIDPDNPYMNPMGVTFREFVQHVIADYKAGVQADFHWKEVVKRCDVCNVEYDVIERFDTLERDHHYLLTKVGQAELYSEIAGRRGNPAYDHSGNHGSHDNPSSHDNSSNGSDGSDGNSPGNPSSRNSTVINASNSASSSTTVRKYLSMLDDRMLWDLADVYKRDLELFGYTPHVMPRHDPRVKQVKSGEDFASDL